MRNTFVLSGLIRRRAELAGEIHSAQRYLETAIGQLAALDVTLTLFGYDAPDLIKPVVKRPVRLFGQYELKRLVLDIQRERPDLTRHKDIALEVIRRKEWDADAALVIAVWPAPGSVDSTLS